MEPVPAAIVSAIGPPRYGLKTKLDSSLRFWPRPYPLNIWVKSCQRCNQNFFFLNGKRHVSLHHSLQRCNQNLRKGYGIPDISILGDPEDMVLEGNYGISNANICKLGRMWY